MDLVAMQTPIETISGFRIGTVERCSASEILVGLNRDAPRATALNTGQVQPFPRINGYVLIPNEIGGVVGLIIRLNSETEASAVSPVDKTQLKTTEGLTKLTISPIGVLERSLDQIDGHLAYKLHRGIAAYPSIGDAVVLPTALQLKSIVEATGEDDRVAIGTAPYADDARVSVDPDKLFGRHLAVFGNTGSGKSCSVAGLIQQCSYCH